MPAAFPLLLAVASVAAVALAATDVISSSRLHRCVDRGDTSPDCRDKFVITLAVAGGTSPTSHLTAWSKATDDRGREVTLSQPVTITVAKTVPRFVYPIEYLQHVNYAPYEYINTVSGPFSRCAANKDESSCGRVKDSAGTVMPYSWGFCCNCDVCQLTSLCPAKSRASFKCSLFGTVGAASCLRFNPLWYAAMQPHPAQTWYDVVVGVQPEGGPKTELVLAPDRLGAHTADLSLEASLVGDFAPFAAPPSLESRLLFLPDPHSDHPLSKAPGTTEWLLIDKADADLSGRSCDKVGVSFEAFATQGSRCSVPAGTCLGGQIHERRASDQDRIAKGLSPRYFAHRFSNNVERYSIQDRLGRVHGDGPAPSQGFRRPRLEPAMSPLGAPHFPHNTTARPLRAQSGPQYVLAFPVEGTQASVVTLTLDAANVSYTIAASDGRIVGANASDFKALAMGATAQVWVTNIGNIRAGFEVAIVDCGGSIYDMHAQAVALDPAQVLKLSFRLVSGAPLGEQATCNVTLRDALNVVVDWRTLSLTATAIDVDKGPQGDTPPGKAANGRDEEGTGCSDCAFYNPICLLGNGCVMQFGLQIAALLIALLVVCVLIKCRNNLCCCCDAADKRRSDTPPPRHYTPRYREPLSESDDSSCCSDDGGPVPQPMAMPMPGMHRSHLRPVVGSALPYGTPY